MKSQTDDPKMKTDNVYRLGSLIFSLGNCDSEYKTGLHSILPHYNGPVLEDSQIRRLQTGCSKDVKDLLAHVAMLHKHCIWLEGSCVVAPSGKQLLISGSSKSGKTLTAAALLIKHGYRIISEMMVLLDPERNTLMSFPAPLSIADDSVYLLKRCAGSVLKPTYSIEWRKHRVWHPLSEQFQENEVRANFDLAVFLERGSGSPANLFTSAMTPSAFVRKLLPTSNLVRIKGTPDKMTEYLQMAHCLRITGGELEQRLDIILQSINKLV